MTCFLYPGQGAQYPNMGTDLFEHSDSVKELFTKAADITGIDVKKLLFEGTADDLKKTDNTQVAITLVNLAATKVLQEKGFTPAGCAGFSLGEYAALATAGIVSEEDVFALVKKRGEAMQAACEGLISTAGETGMAAVLSLAPEAIEEIIATSGIKDVYMANYNSPAQTVLSGVSEGLMALEPLLKEAGARRVAHLKVSGPFHSPLLNDARENFEEFLGGIEFKNPTMPLFSNVTGDIITEGEEAKKLCGLQIVSPVKWIDIEKKIMEKGFTMGLEAGPGKVLCGLFKALDRSFKCSPAGTIENISAIQE